MKRFVLLLALLSFSLFSISQNSILEVVAPAGGTFQGTDISVSWTLGEPVIDTWVNEDAGIMMTSGFQQGNFMITSVPNQMLSDFAVSMYPNPSKNETNILINLPELGNVTITVIDITGRKVIHEEFEQGSLEYSHSLNVSGLKSGLYLVKVHSGSKYSKVLKLIKE
ncbi:MAG: T9SS type A sorting domain-containing protein [Perlabentimonas sp.]